MCAPSFDARESCPSRTDDNKSVNGPSRPVVRFPSGTRLAFHSRPLPDNTSPRLASPSLDSSLHSHEMAGRPAVLAVFGSAR